MTLRPVILSLFSLFVLSGIAQASITVLSPVAGNDNQDQISQAIKTENENGGGTVYLSSGVYDISGPITIKSNIRLTGDQDAIIRVWAPNQWFTGQTGVISNPSEVIKNVEIDSFQIDGNIKNIDKSYSDSRSDTRHDCEKLILFGGWSNSFGSNIKIHNMRLYNAFSDGIYIRFSDGVSAYDNIISNCQHEGIYFSCVTNGLIYSNNIAGITSDCARLDNCVDCKVFDNIFFSYNGDTFGAYAHGENGLQIGDAGVSHGYDGRNKPLHTKNIEVFNNTFSDPGLRAIWLDGAGQKDSNNVYIHDNRFIDAAELETLGVPVGDISKNISYDNPPSVEDSLSVFDLLKHYKGQTSINDYQDEIRYDPVKTQEDKKAFFSPITWLFLLIVIILLYGIKINLKAAFRW